MDPKKRGSSLMPDTEQAQQKAQEVAGQAQEKAQQATGQAKDKLREQVDQRSTQAGEQVKGTAGDIRTVGEQLREQGKDQPAKIAEQAADRAERLGSYLQESNADRILNDVEDFGRRQPLAIAAAGLALGFAASRFLKASSAQRYSTTQRSQSGAYSNGSGAGATARSPQPVLPRTTAPDLPTAPPAPAGGPVGRR
jgi:hypothetical protein